MIIAQAVIVYFVSWWLVWLMALPVGVRPRETVLPGEEKAAPARAYLGRKVVAVTLIAGLVTCAIDFVIHSGIVAVK